MLLVAVLFIFYKDTDLNTFSQIRIEITKDIFKELKIIADNK